jgi:hypothetical protein|tara:strand:- start:319 stop:459 length:141 start_codon:yes stop_codon:yes gene_type:complete
MMTEEQIETLLEDIKTVYEVGIRMGDIDTRSEKRAQIDLLEWVLKG